MKFEKVEKDTAFFFFYDVPNLFDNIFDLNYLTHIIKMHN